MKPTQLCTCVLFAGLLIGGISRAQSFNDYKTGFISGYQQAGIPEYVYDYREYFKTIPDAKNLAIEKNFFLDQRKKIHQCKKDNLSAKDSSDMEVINYEIGFNLERIRLEEMWIKGGRKIPGNGLYNLPDHEEWYSLFARKFTSVKITPAEIMNFGKSEVKKARDAINRIRDETGFKNDSSFYTFLVSDKFSLHDTTLIVNGFLRIDSAVRSHLPDFISINNLPPVYPVLWPEAGADTPPGMYISHNETISGRNVFLYNFFGNTYNIRVMDWLYMHEAIPGHHLQSTLRQQDSLLELFLYPGNFEGWACYVEDYGKLLGLYQDPWEELGKWEWDLVRSLRLVLDAGIHNYGWTHDQALAYWKENIKGQDDIAGREINRVTNWPGQALSYKVGADRIKKMQELWLNRCPNKTIKDFRLWYLNQGMVPLEVLQDQITHR